MDYLRIIVLMLVLFSASVLKAQDSTKPAGYFTDSLTFKNTPVRISETLPLSHQKDTF